MTKITGPYFEFLINKVDANYEFIFLPGNVRREIFEDTNNALLAAFNKAFDMSSSKLIRKVQLEDGTTSIAVDQFKLIQVIKAILEGRAFRNFKIKVTGIDNDGNLAEPITINSPTEAKKAAKAIPALNKGNNDMSFSKKR